jgi:hypothetical protein
MLFLLGNSAQIRLSIAFCISRIFQGSDIYFLAQDSRVIGFEKKNVGVILTMKDLASESYFLSADGGQWDDRSASASLALSDAWLGKEVGCVKVHSALPGPVGWSAWLSCAAAWLAPDARAINAGDAAATIVIASRARIFGFMPFLIEPYSSNGI